MESTRLRQASASSPCRSRVPNRLVKVILVSDPFADLIPPLTFRAVIAERLLADEAHRSDPGGLGGTEA